MNASKYVLRQAEFRADLSDTRFIAIRCTGDTVSGKIFDGVLALEMEGRDCDWEGTQFDGDDFEELMEPLLGGEAGSVYLTPAYTEAKAWWEAQCARECWACRRVVLDDVAVVHEDKYCAQCRDATCEVCGKAHTAEEPIHGITFGDPPPDAEVRYSCVEHVHRVRDALLKDSAS